MKELSKQEIESIELAAVKYVNDRWENSDNKAYFNQTACSKDYIAGATEQAIKAKDLATTVQWALDNPQSVFVFNELRKALLNYKP